MARRLDAGLELLDRQVVDVDGNLVGKVDDLAFREVDDGGPPVLAALLLGPQALGPRLGSRLGRWWAASASRLSGRPDPVAIPVERVVDLGPTIRLKLRLDELPDTQRLERWLRDHVVALLPGSGHASG